MRTIVFAFGLLVAACEDNTPVCVPEHASACVCATGEPGQRICEASGLERGDCVCLPDAGVDAPSADADPEGK